MLVILLIAFLTSQCNVTSNGDGKYLIDNALSTGEEVNTEDNDNSKTDYNIQKTADDNPEKNKDIAPQWDGEKTVTNLKFISIKSENPDIQKKWLIKNSNPFTVEVKWEVYPDIQTGTIMAVPGNTYFYTKTINGSSIIKIYWLDQNGVIHVIEKTAIYSVK